MRLRLHALWQCLGVHDRMALVRWHGILCQCWTDTAPQKCRPIGCDGKRVPPSHLKKHRDGYDFRFPCCLCADGGGRGAYVESAVYSWWDESTKKTDWIARCTANRCGYQGQYYSCSRRSQTQYHLVKIDKYFLLPSSAEFQYPQRGMIACCSTTDSWRTIKNRKSCLRPFHLNGPTRSKKNCWTDSTLVLVMGFLKRSSEFCLDAARNAWG